MPLAVIPGHELLLAWGPERWLRLEEVEGRVGAQAHAVQSRLACHIGETAVAKGER